MSAVARAARSKRLPLTINEASRHLRRATLGVRYSQIEAVQGQRLDQWVDAQLNLAVTANQAYTAGTTQRLPGFASGPALTEGWPNASQYLNWKFYQPEVLRTRLTYAMAELFSVGGLGGIFDGSNASLIHWDILESEVTQGTFRSLIEKITLSQTMARWLTYWRNEKTDGVRQPDENYAREIMQLYTIGLWELNLDGTRRKAGELDPSDPRYVASGTEDVPTYGQSDVANMARVFTGLIATETWDGGLSHNTPDEAWPGYGGDIGHPDKMDSAGRRGWAARLVYAPSYHETSMSKVALQGRVNIPIGTNGPTSLAAALDALVNHPSCAPYLAGRLIRLLVTSNPSPSYVARVASVFRDDGAGQAGNLRAFFRAILLDQDAMAPVSKRLTLRIPSFEEQRLALVLSHAPKLTAEGAPSATGDGETYPGSNAFEPTMVGMYWSSPLQALQNPSVFGRWPAAYSAGGPIFNQGILSPELASLTEGSVTDLFVGSDGLLERIGNCASTEDLADAGTDGNRVAMINRADFLMTGGNTSQSYKDSLLGFLTASRGSGFNTPSGRAATYRMIAVALWLSPWGPSRK